MAKANANDNQTHEVTLITAAQGISASAQGLGEFVDNVPALPTEDLATGYAVIKAFEGNFTDLIKKVRDEFIGTQDEEGNYNADGRLFTDPNVVEDDKGNKMLTFDDGVVLKASKSQKNTFLPEKAEALLQANDLVKQGSDHEFVVKDKDALHDLIEFCTANFEGEKQVQFTKLLTATIENKYTPNPDKILALITTDQLPSDVVDDLYTMKTGYSLLVNKNPYKPKAKKKK